MASGRKINRWKNRPAEKKDRDRFLRKDAENAEKEESWESMT
ncbi:MAG: hypothetical protein ABIJ30_09735 [bacterium]